MTPLAHSLVDPPAEQHLDDRKRQYDGYDHHPHAAWRHHWLELVFDGDDWPRQRVLRDIDPPLDPRCRRYQIGLAFIRDHRVRRSAQIGRWHRDHGGRRRLGLMHAMANPMGTRRCRVPTMLWAMPIDVRTELLTRFDLAHAGLRSF